jgi:type IV secretory pathway VirB2 component (pilin)
MSDPRYNNPYSPPVYQVNLGGYSQSPDGGSKIKVILPGIFLILVGILGLIVSIMSAFMAVGDPPIPDPEVPDWINQVIESGHGPEALVIHILFIFVNLFIIFGGIMMIRTRLWIVCLIASILAALNFGNCCCVLGIPASVWSIIILSLADVRQMFARR